MAMKRIRPVEQYEGCGYPAVDRAGVDRRSFLRLLTTGAAAVGGATLLGGEGAARPMGGAPNMIYRAQITLPQGYRYPGCRKIIRALAVSTWDERLAFYLNKKTERPRILKAIYGVLARHKCVDITDASRRRRVALRVARALRTLYEKRTKRRGHVPSVWLLFRAPRKGCDAPVGPTLDGTPAPQ
jgi:hypothetical protein